MQTREKIDQVLFDIFVTACEGGINYWADVSEYDIWKKDTKPLEPNLNWFSAEIYDTEETHMPPVIVSKQTILRGLHRMADAQGPYYDPNGTRTNCMSVPYLGKYFHTLAFQMVKLPELDHDYDATFADAVVQVGLFGEVRYG